MYVEHEAGKWTATTETDRNGRLLRPRIGSLRSGDAGDGHTDGKGLKKGEIGAVKKLGNALNGGGTWNCS